MFAWVLKRMVKFTKFAGVSIDRLEEEVMKMFDLLYERRYISSANRSQQKKGIEK